MPLTFTSRSIFWSISYDAITVYPLENLGPSIAKDDNRVKLASDPIRTRMSFVWNACSKLSYVREVEFSPIFYQSIGALPSRQRYIRQYDDDHALYHKDSFDHNHSHSHIQFRSMLNASFLRTVLEIFVTNDLLAPSERDAMLAAYGQRFTQARSTLRHDLTGCKVIDARIIINAISNCKDNDILADLHTYLLSVEFDYLRVRATDPTQPSLCQGMDAKGMNVETTSAWALIEESFTLQMAENIRRDCSRFTTNLALDRDTQFKRDHRFFGMNHFCHFKDTSAAKTSKKYDAFCKGEDKNFAGAVKQHFDEAKTHPLPGTPVMRGRKQIAASPSVPGFSQTKAVVAVSTPRKLDEFDLAIKNYQNRFSKHWLFRWFTTSIESLDAAIAIKKAKTLEERYKIANKYLKNYGDRAFGQELRKTMVPGK